MCIYIQKLWHTYIYYRTSYNGQALATQLSNKRKLVNKEVVTCIHNGILCR